MIYRVVVIFEKGEDWWDFDNPEEAIMFARYAIHNHIREEERYKVILDFITGSAE